MPYGRRRSYRRTAFRSRGRRRGYPARIPRRRGRGYRPRSFGRRRSGGRRFIKIGHRM